jgi:hypothetical protein
VIQQETRRDESSGAGWMRAPSALPPLVLAAFPFLVLCEALRSLGFPAPVPFVRIPVRRLSVACRAELMSGDLREPPIRCRCVSTRDGKLRIVPGGRLSGMPGGGLRVLLCGLRILLCGLRILLGDLRILLAGGQIVPARTLEPGGSVVGVRHR